MIWVLLIGFVLLTGYIVNKADSSFFKGLIVTILLEIMLIIIFFIINDII